MIRISLFQNMGSLLLLCSLTLSLAGLAGEQNVQGKDQKNLGPSEIGVSIPCPLQACLGWGAEHAGRGAKAQGMV